jgi:hypothetical protein
VLNFICGVEESGASFTACYRVNFMATSALQLENTLFFAEFWVPHPNLTKPNFCCPLLKPYPGKSSFLRRSTSTQCKCNCHPENPILKQDMSGPPFYIIRSHDHGATHCFN